MFLVVKILLLVAFLNSAVASMKRVLLSTLFLLITKIHVAIDVPKNRFSGRAITASIKLLSIKY